MPSGEPNIQDLSPPPVSGGAQHFLSNSSFSWLSFSLSYYCLSLSPCSHWCCLSLCWCCCSWSPVHKSLGFQVQPASSKLQFFRFKLQAVPHRPLKYWIQSGWSTVAACDPPLLHFLLGSSLQGLPRPLPSLPETWVHLWPWNIISGPQTMAGQYQWQVPLSALEFNCLCIIPPADFS